MSYSLNKATIIGRLGNDPEVKEFSNGNKVCNLSVATSESWKDKATGEKKEKTQWHRIVIWNEHLVRVAESYLKKGDVVYLEGSIETRKYEQNGFEKYTTEIVLQKFNGELGILSSPKKQAPAAEAQAHLTTQTSGEGFDDSIPF